MATKRQVIKALNEKLPGGYLVDNSGTIYFDVDIFAPDGYQFDDGSTSRVVNEFNCGDKSVFWDEVLNEVNNLPGLGDND